MKIKTQRTRAALLVLAIALLTMVFTAQDIQARTASIAVVVNEDLISEADIEARMRLAIVSSGFPNNQEIRTRLRPQITAALIDERLKMQEATKLEIEVTQQEIENAFATIAGQNKISADQFKNALRQNGVNLATLEDQIRSQIAWSKLIQVKLRPDVRISDNEAEAVRNRIMRDEGKAEYQVSEIFLPVETPAQESNVKQLADRLTRQLIEGKAPFPRIASQFSQSAGASRGGDLGWVREGQLSEELEARLAQMNKGEMSKPIRTMAGYHILLLRNKRTIAPATIPSVDGIIQQLGLEQLDRLQRAYLMELKTEAFIEYRNQS